VRHVVIGPGAVGGTIAARLAAAGSAVAVVARGEHGAAIRADGLRLRTPDEEITVPLDVHDDVADLELDASDVVHVCVKSQDTVGVLDRLAGVAPAGVALVCAQNGVDNERQAARRFAHVYGMSVSVFAEHLEPGVVLAFGRPRIGVLDVGRYPGGVDARAEAIAAVLDASGFSSRAIPDVMRAKHGKLLRNLLNILDALGPPGSSRSALGERVVAEGVEVLAAAGIPFVSPDEQRERLAGVTAPEPIDGVARGGGSTLQSMLRGRSSLETDHLNGEVVLIARLHGLDAPLNAGLQALARRAVHEGWGPGRFTLDELTAALGTTGDVLRGADRP
jgi:2-dehydropantoate 2-reductase